MQYKTIIHQMIEEKPKLRRKLAQTGDMLAALDHFADELRRLHLSLIPGLQAKLPPSTPTTISQAAMEIAVDLFLQRFDRFELTINSPETRRELATIRVMQPES